MLKELDKVTLNLILSNYQEDMKLIGDSRDVQAFKSLERFCAMVGSPAPDFEGWSQWADKERFPGKGREAAQAPQALSSPENLSC